MKIYKSSKKINLNIIGMLTTSLHLLKKVIKKITLLIDC